MKVKVLLCITVVLIIGCTDEKPKQQKKPPNYGVFKHQMDSLERAKGVEQQLQQGVKNRDELLRDMGG